MDKSSMAPAVVLGLSPTGLYAIRELGRSGVDVVGVSERKQVASFSKYLTACIIEVEESVLIEALISHFAGGNSRPILIPTSDKYIDFIINNSERLAQYFDFQASYKDGVASQVLAKETFYKLCESNDVLFPKLWEALPNDIHGLRNEITFPCMIKPSRIHDVKHLMNGQKGWVVESLNELDEIITKIPDSAGMLLIQEIVPGSESEITLYCAYFDKEGKPHQAFTCRKLRQYPPGFGSASIVQSSDEQETAEITERFLKSIGYKGIAASEFKRDPVTGKLKIIEINTRPSLWFSASTAAGKNVTLACYYDLLGKSGALVESEQENGVRWRYTFKDFYSMLFYRMNPSFILAAPKLDSVGDFHKKVSAVYMPDDPMPLYGEIRDIFIKILGKFMGYLRAKD